MGLPVLAVVGYAQSFADGAHTSILAPGLGALGAGRGGKDSVLARSLAKLGVGADDIAVISKHDTSTLANDPNETELHERLADSMGRSAAPRCFRVAEEPDRPCQGRRGGVPDDGPVPDPARRGDPAQPQPGLRGRRIGDLRALRVGARDLRLGEKFPLKAGLVTSLGFGHVSGLIALVHPQAFLAALSEQERADYTKRADERVLAGQRRLAAAIAGGRPMYEKPADRRFGHDAPEKRQEAAMLLDPASRLGDDDVYVR